LSATENGVEVGAGMTERSRTARPPVRVALASSLVGLGAAAVLGVVSVLPAHAGELVPGTPCAVGVSACVELDTRRAWLVEDGRVVRGPVPISPGGPGRETPRGEFRVEWKNVDHRSREFAGAPMPFAVFFAPGGIAFHEGDLRTPSAGCVRLARPDARAWFEALDVGERVEVR
jgi:hypothetical protein